MASVEVTITGMLYDKLNRTTQNVVLIGEASLTGVGIGGGPVIPPGGGGGGGGNPPGIWGPTDPRPSNPISGIPGLPGYEPPRPSQPPGIWGGGNEPFPTPPIVIPPDRVPPDMQPPGGPPPAGTTTPVPPPAGSGGWPVQPIAVPPYVVLNYPGVGPIYVTPPVDTTPS